MTEIREYDYAIAIVKFVATLLVINSHMAMCYPGYEFLATGGAFGNSLFFFVSGFTLFLGRKASLGNYLKRRLSRIYPTVIAMALLSTIVWNNRGDIVSQLTAYWFINCIIVYYVLLWPCRRWNVNMMYVIALSLVVTWAIFGLCYDFRHCGLIYGDETFRYFIYFTVMAQGAFMGMNRDKYTFKWWSPMALLLSVVAWCGINLMFPHSIGQLASVPVLYLFCYSMYLTMKAPLFNRLIGVSWFKTMILFCGGLCLESYLVQFNIITDRLNVLFPLNIPLVMAMVLLAAYVLHVAGGLVSQSLDSRPRQWKDLFTIS